MTDVVIVPPEPEPTPVEVEVHIEPDTSAVLIDHAERITRLESSLSDKADRTELDYLSQRIGTVSEEVAVVEEVTAVVAEAVIDVIEQQQEPEPEPEPVEEPPTQEDEAPKSKRHRYWGNSK